MFKKNKKFTTRNFEETQALGGEFAKTLRGGEILALTGDLGTGKTTFVQGLAKGLGIKKRVISPTFIIIRQYQIPASHFKLRAAGMASGDARPTPNFYHIDLYRLEGNLENEIRGLGLSELWGKSSNIVAIEWAEKIKDMLPEGTIWIRFSATDLDREVVFGKN